MNRHEELPSLRDTISNWLGFQLPSIPLPQTLRNLDKAIAVVLLAGGEHLERKIRMRTSKADAQSKIDVEGMYRTEEERRKLENRAATTKAAIEELEREAGREDAGTEIDDDWLNLFTRLAEDKSSEELQGLFGRILAGEVKRPGSFSMRTIQSLATLSKEEAEAIAKFLSYVIADGLVAYDGAEPEINLKLRLRMDELGVAGHPSKIGGIHITYTVPPRSSIALASSERAIVVKNPMRRCYSASQANP